MKTSIFIRSYKGDFPWLVYCLASIKKHCTGFSEVVVAVPEGQLKYAMFDKSGIRMVEVPEKDGYDGYMSQQISKLHADEYTDADYILYLDSDTVLIRDCSPEMFFIEEKPFMLITPYAHLGDAVPWKPFTEKALKFECPFETMRRLPFFYPSWALSQFRNYMGVTHGKTVDEYIMDQPGRSFSEFNALGSFVHHFYHDKFFWWDTTVNQNLPQQFVKQNWSWGGLTPEIKRELERLVA